MQLTLWLNNEPLHFYGLFPICQSRHQHLQHQSPYCCQVVDTTSCLVCWYSFFVHKQVLWKTTRLIWLKFINNVYFGIGPRFFRWWSLCCHFCCCGGKFKFLTGFTNVIFACIAIHFDTTTPKSSTPEPVFVLCQVVATLPTPSLSALFVWQHVFGL